MTQRLPPIDPTTASDEVKSALKQVRLGTSPVVMQTMANSSTALTGYLALDSALSAGTIDVLLRQQIALVVAETNACSQCIQDHTAASRILGMDEATIRAARQASSGNPKVEAALQFARKVAEYRGEVTDEEFDRMRRAGYSNEEIAEIIANVVLSIYANYFNIIAQPT